MTYKDIDVNRDRAGSIEMMRKSGQRGVPVIVVDDQVVVGFDEARLDQLLSVRPKRGLGAAVADASAFAAGATGALVGGVRPGSAAEGLGLRKGDIVMEAGGQSIGGADDLERVVGLLPTNSRIVIKWLRQQQEMRGQVVL